MAYLRFSLWTRRAALAAVAALVAALVVSVAPAQAAALTVTNTNDSGPGSLRQAILDANESEGGDTITISATGTIVLESMLPVIGGVFGQEPGSIAIDGPGPSSLTISGADAFRVFAVNIFGVLELEGVTIAHGFSHIGSGIDNTGIVTVANTVLSHNVAEAGGGGAIFNNTSGTFTLTDSVVSDSSGGFGGAVRNGGALTIANTEFSRNSGDFGGAIGNFGGALVVSDSSFADNSSPERAGAIYNHFSSSTTIERSTFERNAAAYFGGAIANAGSLTVTNGTFVGNSTTNETSEEGGGGIWTVVGPLRVTNSTFTGNSAATSLHPQAAGSIFKHSVGTAVLANTIVAHSGTAPNCAGAITDGGGNLQHPGTDCGGTIPSADPMLGALDDYGGPTRTVALLPESPALDAAVAVNCPATDQRGVPRPQGAGCDIGAFEALPSNPAVVIESVRDEVAGHIGGANSALSDKAEDVRDKLNAALAELDKAPPDGAAAIGNLEGAVGDLEAMGKDGLLATAELIETLADAGKLLAQQAIDAASGDPAKIVEAEQVLAAGEALQAAGKFKEALSKYKEALSKAESA